MFARFSRISFCCSLISGLFAQSGPVYGLIAGTVLDGAAKTPLRKAVVTLTMMAPKPQDAVAWSDDSGRFAFGYLSAGRYQLRAQVRDYQPEALRKESPGRPPEIIVLQAGENRSDFIIRLFRFASISGTVLDDTGEPVEAVGLRVARTGFALGPRNNYSGPMAVTDAHGHYRISNVQPGKYTVALDQNNRPAIHMSAEVSAAALPSRPYIYMKQYYPGADTPASAGVVTVEGGKEVAGIDFRLVSRPAAMIQGHVIPPANFSGTLTNVMMILREPGMGWGGMNGGAGPPEFAFNMGNVAPGPHILIAQATLDGKPYRGMQRIEVGEEMTPDINLALEAGVTISGTVTITGPDAEQHAASFVALSPGDDIPWYAPPLRASVNPDGTFKISNVPTGVWDIDAGPVPKGGYMKSMRLGDQDVLTEEMHITSSTTAPLKIVIGTKGAKVEGEVTNASGDPVRATVLLMPEGRFSHIVSFRHNAVSDEKGHYEILGVMPGTYKIYALEEFDMSVMQDAESLQPFQKSAVAVELKEGQTTSQDLHTMIPAPGGK